MICLCLCCSDVLPVGHFFPSMLMRDIATPDGTVVTSQGSFIRYKLRFQDEVFGCLFSGNSGDALEVVIILVLFTAFSVVCVQFSALVSK